MIKKRYLNQTHILYFIFVIMILMLPLIRNIQFEPLEIGVIGQMLHPKYHKMGISYAPYCHYDYLIVYTAKLFGYKDNFTDLAKFFWLLETLFALAVLTKLCNYIFKKDNMVLVMAFVIFMLAYGEAGQIIDQKTMTRPLYFLAVYCFLKERWLISALATAAIFYLHIGIAVWWVLPSSFALFIIFLQKRVSFKKLLAYPIIIFISALPVIYFYLKRTDAGNADSFFINYYYYACSYCSSVLLTFFHLRDGPIKVLNILLMLGIFFMGYHKADRAGHKNKNIMPIVFGVFILYILNFVFADMLKNGAAITLQLLRSILNVELFSSLFLAFLFSRQVKRGNYVLFLIFLAVSFYYQGILRKFFGNDTEDIALSVVYSSILIYEAFEEPILRLAGRLRKIRGSIGGLALFRQPIMVAIFLVFFLIPKLPMIKHYFRRFLNLPGYRELAEQNADDYLYKDIAKFTNEHISDKDAILLIPFLKFDFDNYTNHKTFVTAFTPLFNMQYNNKDTSFKQIMKYGFNYPADKLLENCERADSLNAKWNAIWRNLSETVICGLKERYGVTHVIRERELPLKFPVLYQNKFYVVYKVD